MSNYEQVNRLNEVHDRDFHLDTIDQEEEVDAKEASERHNTYQQVCVFLNAYMPITKVTGIVANIMHHWTPERDAYYMDECGNEAIFYRGFEITKQDMQWFCEEENGDALLNFCVTDLLEGLRCIDFINEGEM